MSVRCTGFSKTLLTMIVIGLVSVCHLDADSGDVEDAHDYTGFARLPGFVITDFDEDNPAGFDFAIARPLPIDANHVESQHVDGHRLVIRYEAASGADPATIMEVQQHFEKLATDGGFTLDKTGAVGDVSETFHARRGAHDVWIHLEPGTSAHVLTIVEAASTELSAPTAAKTPAESVATPAEDPLYATLMKKGRVVLPLDFLPSKPDLNTDSQPMIDRVVHLMRLHPTLLLRIEGHTDATNDDKTDWELSSQRARVVQAMLVMAGIGKDRLDAVGYGGTVPRGSNSTAEGRTENRRVELAIWKK